MLPRRALTKQRKKHERSTLGVNLKPHSLVDHIQYVQLYQSIQQSFIYIASISILLGSGVIYARLSIKGRNPAIFNRGFLFFYYILHGYFYFGSQIGDIVTFKAWTLHMRIFRNNSEVQVHIIHLCRQFSNFTKFDVHNNRSTICFSTAACCQPFWPENLIH